MAHEQYANDFTLLLDIAKQQDPDGCRVSSRLRRAKHVNDFGQNNVQDILQQFVFVMIVTKKGGVPDISALCDVTNRHGLVALFQRQYNQGPGQQMLCSFDPPVLYLHGHLQTPPSWLRGSFCFTNDPFLMPASIHGAGGKKGICRWKTINSFPSLPCR